MTPDSDISIVNGYASVLKARRETADFGIELIRILDDYKRQGREVPSNKRLKDLFDSYGLDGKAAAENLRAVHKMLTQQRMDQPITAEMIQTLTGPIKLRCLRALVSKSDFGNGDAEKAFSIAKRLRAQYPTWGALFEDWKHRTASEIRQITNEILGKTD